MAPLAGMFMVAALATPAQAALIVDGGLTLDTNPADIYQQTAINPCVIGPPNCLNGGFPFEPAGSGGNGSVFDETSPNYTVAQITGVTGASAFTMGLDYNQTVNPQTLFIFEAIYFNGAVELSRQTFELAGGTLLPVNNNGVGYSDFLLSGFVIPALATNVTFHANWWNNDGADRYFLIGGQAVPCDPATDPTGCGTVPEPTTLALFGLGLLGAGFARRRAKK